MIPLTRNNVKLFPSFVQEQFASCVNTFHNYCAASLHLYKAVHGTKLKSLQFFKDKLFTFRSLQLLVTVVCLCYLFKDKTAVTAVVTAVTAVVVELPSSTGILTAEQRETDVTSYCLSKQLLLFGFARRSVCQYSMAEENTAMQRQIQ